MKSFLKLIFLPLLSVGLFIFVYINNIQPKLGLDLQGGVSVILTAEEGTDPELIEQAVEIMRTRISAFGEVQEPEISISGENSVLVQLPGLTDQEKAIEAVGTTGLLTFRPVLNSSLNLGYSPALTITPNEDDPDNPTVTAPAGVDQLTGLTLDDNPLPQLYKALKFGISDYFQKMGFKKAVIGASGGIDSAVVQALAVKALGKENVLAVLMPSRYSSRGSIDDAIALSENLGNEYIALPIEDVHSAYESTLAPIFEGKSVGIAEENLQARSRAVLLMGISNKTGNILLNTSNKSELAVGYSTLYGDLCGSLSVIGDVYKTQVYALAKHINRYKETIPNAIIEKEPSAELRPDQKDTDSLPSYTILDGILRLYLEEQKGKEEIIMEGYDPSTVNRIINLVNSNEYKRYQAPPILRVSPKAFGKGRIMPLVAKYL